MNSYIIIDLQPENILVEKDGKTLKIADLGSCRATYNKQPYTEYISTRWYRAPECLLTDGYYGPEMDIWGAGCVLFEIIALYPLFPGSDEIDQINRIHKVLGTPSREVLTKFISKNRSNRVNFNFPYQKGIGISHLLSHASNDCVDLITKVLAYDLSKRISAKDALLHPYMGLSKLKNEASTSLLSDQLSSHQQSNQQALQQNKQPKDIDHKHDSPLLESAKTKKHEEYSEAPGKYNEESRRRKPNKQKTHEYNTRSKNSGYNCLVSLRRLL